MEGQSKPKGLKIYKVKDLEDKGKYAPLNPILPQPPFLLIGYGSVRSGKTNCVYEYSNVETKEGVKYIKNVKIGDYVKGDEGFVEVLDVLKQGIQKCYRIILENDMEVIITDNHQIQTKQGLKRLKHISDEDITTEEGDFKIKSKEDYGEVMTYDLSVKSKNNLFFSNGILVHNSLINMMRREDMYGTDYWDDVLVISNTAGNDPKMYKFMGDAFRLEDHYENKMIDNLIASQKSYSREEMPTALLILDDIISKDFKKSSGNAINSLATRFRHFELSIMIFVQSARAVSNMIRSNATDILIYRQQSNLEWDKLQEEYSDLAPKNFANYYKISQLERYNFLYIDAQQNPAHFYSGFSELIGIGDKMLWKGKLPDDSDDEVFE
jgi:hypothetical protein